MRNFEEILSRQRSQELTLKFYKIFKDIRDFSFRDQLQKAAVSISNNIAEGFERKSNNEFRYFLYVAKGSSGEVRSMLYLAKKLNYITEEKFNEFYDETKKISELIHGLIRSLK